MLNKVKFRITQFMQGRYGLDYLYLASITLYVVLFFIQIFAQIPLVNLLLAAFAVWIFYRIISKNIPARRAENQKFMAWAAKAKKRINPIWQRIRDVRSYRYRKCPECNVTLRLPNKRGQHQTTCPKCQHRFKVTIRI